MSLFKKKFKTNIKVDENVLTLYLGLKALLQQSPQLPKEYLVEGYKYLNKIKELSDIDNDYLDDDLIEYSYSAVYEKSKVKEESDK